MAPDFPSVKKTPPIMDLMSKIYFKEDKNYDSIFSRIGCDFINWIFPH